MTDRRWIEYEVCLLDLNSKTVSVLGTRQGYNRDLQYLLVFVFTLLYWDRMNSLSFLFKKLFFRFLFLKNKFCNTFRINKIFASKKMKLAILSLTFVLYMLSGKLWFFWLKSIFYKYPVHFSEVEGAKVSPEKCTNPKVRES